jgi:hypothetical protein
MEVIRCPSLGVGTVEWIAERFHHAAADPLDLMHLAVIQMLQPASPSSPVDMVGLLFSHLIESMACSDLFQRLLGNLQPEIACDTPQLTGGVIHELLVENQV